MKNRQRILGLLFASFLLLPLFTLSQKTQDLNNEELQSWWQKDLEKDTIPGISLDRAYAELLQNKVGEEVIVAVLDTKIDINHEDLKDQIWVNIDEIPNNGIDDDNNGYIDDINGWDFLGTTTGEDVVLQLAECTRIVKKYQGRYATINANEVADAEKADYALYQKARQMLDEEIALSSTRIQSMDALEVDFLRAKDTVIHFLSRTKFSSQEVDSLAKQHPDLQRDLSLLSELLSYGFDETGFEANRLYVSKYLETIYNVDYDDRVLLKDKQHDLTDVPYGDATVINNSLEFQHSTPVSGLIGATRDNDLGINGVTNNVKIMPVVMVAEGDEYDKEVALAIRYAVDNGADIINMSWGKYLSLHVEWVRDAFRYAQKHDVLLVSGSGNDSKNSDEELNYPNDAIDGVEFVDNFIMAGGHSHKIDSTLVSRFSNYGKTTVDLFAPASKIYSLGVNDTYHLSGGTSYASPLTAGVAALVKSYYPNVTASELKQILMQSGTPIDMEVLIPFQGNTETKVLFSDLSKSGRILNAYNALQMAEKMSKLKNK